MERSFDILEILENVIILFICYRGRTKNGLFHIVIKMIVCICFEILVDWIVSIFVVMGNQ